MVGPGILETKIERQGNRFLGRLGRVRVVGSFVNLFTNTNDDQNAESIDPTDYSKEIAYHIDEVRKNLEKSEDDWLLKYENILVAYNHFRQARNFMNANGNLPEKELDKTAALIEAKASQLIGPFTGDLQARSAKDNLTGVSAIERFHAVYSLAAICNEFSKKPQFGIPDLHRILYEHQVKSHLGSASAFIKHIALLTKKSPEIINNIANLAMNTDNIDITSQLENAGLNRNIYGIARDDLRKAIIGHQKDEAKFIFSELESEVFYECNKDVDKKTSDLLFETNYLVLLGALLTLKDEKRPCNDLGALVEFSGKDEFAQFYKRSKRATSDERVKAIEEAKQMEINLGESFVYNPRLTGAVISFIQANFEKPDPEKDAALRLQLTNNLEPRRPKTEFTTDERERIVDAAYEALTDYKSGMDALRECKNYFLMILPRVILQKIVDDRKKTEKEKDAEKVEETRSLAVLLEENDSLVKKRLYVSTEEELSREKGVGSRLVERLISESVNKACYLIDIHNALCNETDDKKALKLISETRAKEMAAIDEKYNSLKLRENGNDTKEEQFRNRIREIERKLKGNSELHEDSNRAGKLTAEKLSPLEELKTSFENGRRDIYTMYSKKEIETGLGEGADKIKALVAESQLKISDLVKEYNTKIDEMKREEKKQLKDSYMRMCEEPEAGGLDFTSVLLNLKTIVEKMKYVADKQTDDTNKVKSYQAINELQRAIGKFVLAKYEENYKKAASMSEMAFLEANRFYYKEIIGIKGTNGSMHFYNPEYERLFAKLGIKEFRPLEELAKFERVLSGRLGDSETPLNKKRSEEYRKETIEAFMA